MREGGVVVNLRTYMYVEVVGLGGRGKLSVGGAQLKVCLPYASSSALSFYTVMCICIHVHISHYRVLLWY